jgi:hypothetical protein
MTLELLGVTGAFGGPPASLPKKWFNAPENSGGSDPLLLKQNFPLASVWHCALWTSRLVSLCEHWDSRMLYFEQPYRTEVLCLRRSTEPSFTHPVAGSGVAFAGSIPSFEASSPRSESCTGHPEPGVCGMAADRHTRREAKKWCLIISEDSSKLN